MKILHLGKFYPPEPGGIETATRELAEAQCRAGHDVAVLCASRSLRTAQENPMPGLRIVRAATMGTVASASVSAAIPVHLSRLLSQVDLLHVHMPDPMAALAVRMCRPRVPIVLHWHSDVVRQRISYRLYEPLERWLLGRADAVIATSPPYASSSSSLRPWSHKVRVVPLGITDPAPLVDPVAVRQLRQRHGGKRLVFGLGRMTWYKGYDTLIRASGLLPPDVRVVIAGDGPMYAPWRDLADGLGLGDRVSFPGALDAADAVHHHAAADVFCLPSTARAEAFGLSLLEAMAHARPVVATRIPGSGVGWVSTDGESGLHVPVADPPALASALHLLLGAPELAKRLGDAAREHFVRRFTAEAMAAGVQQVYAELGRRTS